MQLKQFAIDAEAAANGRRIELAGGGWVVLARANNKQFIAHVRRRTASYGKRVDLIPPDVIEEITREALARYVVLDWGGIVDGDEPVPYSPENVARVFKAYPDFADALIEMARDYTTFREQQDEEDRGN
jgi:hypothetical protein